MPTSSASRIPRRHEVEDLVSRGVPYDEIARRLDVSPGLVYLIATGLPADGSDAPTPDAHERPGFLPASQHLANPATTENPTESDTVTAWMRSRAAADEQMQSAARARTADPGDESQENDDQADLVDLLTRDHNRVNALLQQLATIPGVVQGGTEAQMRQRRSIVDMITVTQSRHETGEQQFLWPTVRSSVDDGEERAAEGLRQEERGAQILAALSRLDGTEEEFDQLVEELSAASRKHVAFEEPVFLELRGSMPTEELRELGGRFLSYADHAPTRPHPHAPQSPAGALRASAALGGALDRMRDATGDRPAEAEGRRVETAATPPEGEEG